MVRMLESLPFDCSTASAMSFTITKLYTREIILLGAYKRPASGLDVRLRELGV